MSLHLTNLLGQATWPSMTIHVNIGEAKTRLSELIAAALRGEEVVLNKAGKPVARLVPDADAVGLEREARRAKREAWFGSMEGRMPSGAGDLFLEPTMSDEEVDRLEIWPN